MSATTSDRAANSSAARIVNIAAYKFVSLDNLKERREALRCLCREQNLRGTILLSREGINLFVAGTRRDVDVLLAYLRSDDALHDLEVKRSLSDEQPFNRMLVKIKREIIAFGVDGIDPENDTAEKISAGTLRNWLSEGRDLILYDVRNDYEVEVGTFENAVAAGIDDFRHFPEAVERLPQEAREKPVVMFCTGGIRCEKAGPYMTQRGFRNVFQLDGGILKYFEECGGEHYRGDCFVFDKRVAVDPRLAETDSQLCFNCQQVLDPVDMQSAEYVPGESCPYCRTDVEPARSKVMPSLAERQAAIERAVTPLPGSQPYENLRPISVPQRCDGMRLPDWLESMHTHYTREQWTTVIQSKLLLHRDRPATFDTIVRAGQRYQHVLPDHTEPDVNAAIELLHEDDEIIVVHKPAPLPMHPGGRFNRNTLGYILHEVFGDTILRSTHRLDAGTSGVLVMCKTRLAAANLSRQFRECTVEKIYVACVQGVPTETEFECDAPISSGKQALGKRQVDPDGDAACTRFRLLEDFSDETSLIEARPKTGRTNQIRIHLAHLGLPIRGDDVYSPDCTDNPMKTASIDAPPLCLHAASLAFAHPATGERVSFTAQQPRWADRDYR